MNRCRLLLLMLAMCAAGCASRPNQAQTLVPATAPAQVYYGRRLEPPGGCVIHGAGQSGPDDLEYCRACPPGRRPMVMMSYTGLMSPGRRSATRASTGPTTTATMPATRRFPATRPLERQREWLAKMEGETGSFIVPQIGLGMSRQGEVEAINNGARDAAIEQFCQELKALDRPVFLRIGYEFNGDWNGYEPDSYKRAFIRIVTALRKARCDKVAAVWCFAVEGTGPEFMHYYPGDEYVDWWAIDLFSPEHVSSALTRRFIATAAEHRCPVMIGESTPRWIGARNGEHSWRAWYARYVKLLRENPNVKCFCLIVDDWGRAYRLPSPLNDWGDGRLWLDGYVWPRWLEEMSDPRYLHGTTKELTERLLGVGAPRP